VEARGSEVVVVDQRQVHLITGQQAECLTRLVLIDVQAHRGMLCGQELSGRQHELPDGRGERRHPDGAGWRRRRIQVKAGSLEGGEDRDRMISQAAPGRSQPHPPPGPLDQRRARLPGQGRDLLGDGGGGHVHGLGDRPHRAEAGQLQQQLQAARIHAHNVHDH